MNLEKCPRRAICVLVWFAIILAMASTASASWKEKVLYSFQGGSDGQTPAGGVVFDKAGNLYGATVNGGADNCSPMAACGTVFQLQPPANKGEAWTETVLYVFKGKAFNDGENPDGGLVIDAAGNLYGTAAYGGTGDCVLLGIKGGCGTVYEMSPPAQKGDPWTETTLYSFKGGKDGYVPQGNLVFDSAGNLYGATLFGGGKGTTCDPFYQYCGTVFELSPPKQKGGKWTEKVLHSFAGGTDGANPNGGLVLDSKGNVYGTTYMGGSGDWGTVYQLKPPTRKGGVWTEKQLLVFTSGNAGGLPRAGVIFDSKANLYGTTVGTIFRLAPPYTKSGRWKHTILSTFNNYEAYDPDGALVFDQGGSLYGTTYSSNTFHGTVFRLKPPSQRGSKWTFAILYGFLGPPDGGQPAANLIFDKNGNLYSTTQKGGTGACSFYGCGTVFEVSPPILK
jgi:uncharacterized repeat protein (TIGR03803 family)